MANGAPSKGMAVAGGVMAIIIGALMVIGAILVFIAGGSMLGGAFGEAAAIAGIILLLIGIPAIILGAFACKGKPGPTLGAAILFTILSVLGLIGLMGGATLANIIGLILYLTTTILLYIGYGQAKTYQQSIGG